MSTEISRNSFPFRPGIGSLYSYLYIYVIPDTLFRVGEPASKPKEAAIAWEGDSKEIISAFPLAVKENLGFQLRQLQEGEQPTDYRPVPQLVRESSNCETQMSEPGTE